MEISHELKNLRDEYTDEYKTLGSDHAQYELANKTRLEGLLDDVPGREGRFGP